MTIIITRYFDSRAKARAAVNELIQWQRLSPKIVRVFNSDKGLTEALTAETIPAETAQAYAERMAKGGAVVMVHAGYKPLGVARITREVTAKMGAADMGDLVEEAFVKERRSADLSILDDHPRIFWRPRDPDSDDYHMADWPIPLISRRRPAKNAILKSHPHFFFYPMPLLIETERYTKSIFPRHARMADWPIPLLSDRKPYTESIIGRHARMANFPLPLISRRKPKNRSIFPRHQRMATVPFPLLINGKTGTNALIPGGPRMANFPIPLLSRRKPYTGSIIGRHSRMARFPIPLLSDRKPYTGSAIPRHGRMADALLPLVIPRDGTGGFSFSKMLGWKTISRR